jgi:hypothetical protein
MGKVQKIRSSFARIINRFKLNFNKMEENSNIPQYTTETMLAYLDILGFTEFLKDKPLPQLVEIIENILRADNCSSYVKMLKINTKLISDTFVVFAKVTEPKHLTAYFVYLGTIISRIHTLGKVITRGCVANGDHYSTDTIWISPVYVTAYIGEHMKSIHPRVILDDSAINVINRINSGFLETTGLLLRDDDGYRYINYLMCLSDTYQANGDHVFGYLNNPTLRDGLIKHRKSLIYGLDNYKKHLSKYYWLSNYHNTHIMKNIHLANKEDLLIDLTLY